MLIDKVTFKCEKKNSMDINVNYNGELYINNEYIYIEIISNNIYPMKKYDNKLKLSDLKTDSHFEKNTSLTQSFDIIKNFIKSDNITLNDYKNNKYVIYLYSKDKKDLLLFVLHPREISEKEYNEQIYKQIVNINNKILQFEKKFETIEDSINLITNNKIDNQNKYINIIEDFKNNLEDNKLFDKIKTFEENFLEINEEINSLNFKYNTLNDNIQKENNLLRDTMNQNFETIKKANIENDINKLKEEIFPKLNDLNKEFNTLKDNIDTELLCIICNSKKENYIFEPCNHTICCEECSKKIFTKDKTCPICKTKIKQIKKVFS